MTYLGTEGSLLPGSGIVSDPKGKKPDSDHPHEDDLPQELHPDLAGEAVPGEDHPLDLPAVNASTEEFNFSGPMEELDFTEPADFAFPTEQPLESETSVEQAGAEGIGLFGSEESALSESPQPQDAMAEPVVAGEGIADLEAAAEAEEPKPKFALPAWVGTVEWIAVGVLAVGSLLAIIVSIILFDKNAKQVTLTLNIACPVLLGLIPYSLWRCRTRWVTPAASAIYTVMLALSSAALIAGTWFQGLELSRYDWQFTKTRVAANKPPPVVLVVPPQPSDVKEPEPPAKGTAEPAAEPAAAKGTGGPMVLPPAAKGTAEPAAK
jgi:hypothetical protein